MVMITIVMVVSMMMVMVITMLMLLTKSNLSWRLSIGGSLSCSASRPRDLVSHHRLCLRGDYVHFFFGANFCIFLIHHLLSSIYWTCMQESFADVPIFE